MDNQELANIEIAYCVNSVVHSRMVSLASNSGRHELREGLHMSAGIFWEETEHSAKKPEVVEWEWGEPVKHCGRCKVRINGLPDKYDRVYCPNGHLNERPKA